MAEHWYAELPISAERPAVAAVLEALQSEGQNDFQDLTTAYEAGRSLQLSIIVFGLIISLILGGTVLRTITRSLARVRHQLHELAEGEGDLTGRLQTSHDEVGLIAAEVNRPDGSSCMGLVKRVQESGDPG